MKWTEIKDRPVVSVAEAEKLGFVDDLLLDPAGKRVLGLRVRRGGMVTHREALLLSSAQAIGEDAVTVQDGSALNKESAFSDLRDSVAATAITGSRMLSEDGREIGNVGDLVFELPSGQVSEYLLSVGLLDRLRHEEHGVPVAAVTSLGNGLVVVQNNITAS